MDKIRKIKIQGIVKQLVITILLNVSTTALLMQLRKNGFTDVNIVVVYILSVLVTSSYTKGYIYGIIASVISMLSFNFYFTEPIYTFKVDDSAYIITLAIMLLSSVFTRTLASKLIRSKELADEREKQSHILYSITSSLAKTSDLPEVAAVSAGCLSSLFECDVVGILMNQKDQSLQAFLVKQGSNEVTESSAGLDTIELVQSGYTTFPLNVHDSQIGYVCLKKAPDELDRDKNFLLDSVIIQITTAMERVILIRDREAAKSETERERFKSNLLRAISHDIRTPLTRITGAAHILQHDLGEDESRKLILGIYDDSSWLAHLVENILSLTKIQEGKLNLHIQPEAVEEIIAGAMSQAGKYSPDHKIMISVPDDVLFIPMDGKLIEQVLINLIINSIEHTTSADEIHVSVYPENDIVWFEVKDTGTGINEEDLPYIFDMFYISPNKRTDGKHGMRLGLAICKAIVNFHGGEIYAIRNIGGGSAFRFYLNMKDRND